MLKASVIFAILFSHINGIETSQDVGCGDSPRPMRISARHIETKGVGYNTGYTTLETFLAPPPTLWRATPFIDLRGHIFDDGKWAANGGVGIRTLYRNRVFGAYTYYDYRNTKHKNVYNQISFGLETLGNWWDLRANGYVPIGRTKSPAYDLAFSKFSGNNAFLKRKFEYALAGGNGEIGSYLVKGKNGDLYAAAGPYYLKGTLGDGIWGSEVRLRGTYKTWLALEANYSYDHVFKNIVQGQVAFSYAFGPKNRLGKDENGGCRLGEGLYQRMVYPVVKNEIIAVDHKTEEDIAVNPLTGDPYFIWFVENTSHSAGTFESPFATLMAAQDASNPYEIIYVLPGDLTSTGMNAGITLQDHQKFWGASIPHILNTTVGSLQIPSLYPAQLFVDLEPNIALPLAPTISNISGNDVVTVRNGNEVSGFNIVNLTGHGVTASSITDLSVSNCIIRGPSSAVAEAAVYGINVSNVSGTVSIDSNLIYQGITGVNISASGIQNATYILSNNDGPAVAIVSDSAHGNFLVSTYSDCTNLSTIISGNGFTCTNAAITMTFDNGETGGQACSVLIDNNDIDCDGALGVSGNVILTLNHFANVDLVITNNILSTPNTNAISITQNGSDANGSTLAFTIDNNAFNSYNACLAVSLNSAASLTGSITNNDLVFDVMSGVLITAADTSTIPNLLIADNEISGVLVSAASSPDSDAISMTFSTDATGSVNISSNNMQAGANTIELITHDHSSLTASVIDNTITHSEIYAMAFTTYLSSTGNWTVDGNTMIASGTDLTGRTIGSAVITANGSSTTTLSFNNNISDQIFELPTPSIGTYQFTNNDSATFHLTSFDGNTGALTKVGFPP